MTTDVFNIDNKKVGETELSARLFSAPWRPALVAQVLRASVANRRPSVALVKARDEVRGGGRKPWRQKGTGRARHGSIRSPLWRGGGKAHGPTSERDYSQKINAKMKQGALASVLSKKLRDGELKIFDRLDIPAAKTKNFVSLMTKLGFSIGRPDALVIPAPEHMQPLARASANVPKAKVISPASLNIYDAVKYRNIVIDQSAIPVMERHYTKIR